jgi:hypothetical protein|tara:strand:- start:326 stop:514 length:189 start_codon:yes stop_codon:yes gene_type:complete
MANVVAIRHLKKYLKSGPKTTDEIYNHLNSKLKWGITMSELSKILPRYASLISIEEGWRNIN